MKFAVQLYSLRELAAREGAEAVLRTVSEAGYDGVEFAGFYDLSPEQMKALLQKYRLEPVSAHIGAGEVASNMDYIQELGIRNVFVPYVTKNTFDDETEYGVLCRKIEDAYAILRGKALFGYHNHAHEFEDGKDRVQKLLTDLPFLKSELDVFWAKVAGLDPVAYMQKLGDRLAFVHIKEAAAKDPAHTAQPVVGEGAVDMRGVFDQMKKKDIGWAVLEVEQYPCPEAEYLVRSLKNMKKLAEERK